MSARSREPLSERVRRRLRRAAAGRRSEPARSASRDPDAVRPDIVEERSDVGHVMDALVMQAKRKQQPLGVDPDYDLLREDFDHLNFMLEGQASRDLPANDPIRVFLRQGADAVNSPNYNFAMANYLERYPERREGSERSPYLEWIKRGRSAGEIADPAKGIENMAEVLGLEPERIVDVLVATRTDMMERLRTGELGRMFAKAAEIEPLIGAVWGETTRTRLIPLAGTYVVGQVAAIHTCQAQAGFKRARLVVVTDRPRSGGGRAFESDLAHAVGGAIDADDIVVIYTDEGGQPGLGSLPPKVREVDFASAVAGLPEEHKQQSLVSLLRTFEADAIVNIGSRAFYQLLAPYGKALATSERIFLVFTSHTQRAAGNWDGWSLRWFYAGFDLVAGFITDGEYLRDQLTDMYQLSEADRQRIHVFRAPVDPELAAVSSVAHGETSRRPVVHWVGRRSRRKRMDIALEVARRMPDVDFRFWDEGDVRGRPATRLPGNVRLAGLPGHISELDLSQADAWLFTAAWAGVPSLLLDVAMTEIPIVASLVGGVGEVLSDQDSWPVADWQDPEAYEKALREILSDQAAARLRSRELRARLERDRTQRAYSEYAAEVLLDRTASIGEAR